MKISVIIPSYKPKDYLWKCLDSMCEQTFPKDEFEVIIVLNGCNEPYSTQLLRYIGLHKSLNIVFIHIEKAGVSNARNIGLEQAKGDFVAFIDDDDYVSNDYLAELFKKASRNRVSICYPYAFEDCFPEKQKEYSLTNAYERCVKKDYTSLNSVARKFFSGPCMKLIHKDIIQGRRFDERFKNGEDSIFMFLISDQIDCLSFTSKEAVYYRRYRENSAYNARRSRMQVLKNELRMIHEYFKIYFKRPLNYSFLFFITRVIGAIKTMIIS